MIRHQILCVVIEIESHKTSKKKHTLYKFLKTEKLENDYFTVEPIFDTLFISYQIYNSVVYTI
jgi:hypothetical protein